MIIDDGSHPVGVDLERLTHLADHAFGGDAQPTPAPELAESLALVVVHHDRVIAERYAPDVDAGSTLISWSMAKSITHALVGVLVAEGRLDPAARAPVAEWADCADPRHGITVDHLLTMTPGLRFVEDYVDDSTSNCLDMLFGAGSDDMGAYAASLPLDHEPGTRLNYSSGTTNIICRIIADIVGRGDAAASWIRAELFDPVGMTSAIPRFDGSGVFVGSSYVYATARDFARFGLLYLHDGVADGRRILPEGWVAHGTSLRTRDDDGSGYGAQWWVWDDPAGSFCAQGYETQRILVVPDRDLVVVRLGKTPSDAGPAVDAWIRELVACIAVDGR